MCTKNNYNDMDIQMLMGKIFSAVQANSEGIYLINRKENMYYTLKSSDMLYQLLGDDGSYPDMCKKLFCCSRTCVSKMNQKYYEFMESGIPVDKVYHRHFILGYPESESKYFSIYPIDKTISSVIITAVDREYENIISDKSKEKALHEIFLFSMIANLDNNTIQSCSVPEIAPGRQDYFNISYLKWRKITSKMFLSEDKPMFLKYSDPEYIRKKLTEQHSFSFDSLMQNLESNYIWVKISFTRIHEFLHKSCVFVFTVQDIHEEKLQLLQKINEFEKQSYYDNITGAYNIDKLKLELQKSILQLQINYSPLYLMTLSINHLQILLNTYTHEERTQLLMSIFETVQSALPDNCIIGRMHEGAFLCICPGVPLPVLDEHAKTIFRRLQAIASNTPPPTRYQSAWESFRFPPKILSPKF